MPNRGYFAFGFAHLAEPEMLIQEGWYEGRCTSIQNEEAGDEARVRLIRT